MLKFRYWICILLTDKKIANMEDLMPVLEPVAREGKGLLIIAEDVEGQALTTLVVNRLRGTLKVAAVKAPGFGDRRKEMLQDIAILTGGVVISEERGFTLANANVQMLGMIGYKKGREHLGASAFGMAFRAGGRERHNCIVLFFFAVYLLASDDG